MTTITRPDTQGMPIKDILAGDVIHVWGARVLIQGAANHYPSHHRAGGTVWSWGDMPIISGAIATFESLKVWTIQSTDDVRWDVERGPLGRSVDMMGAACDASNAHDQACRLGCGTWFDWDLGTTRANGVPCEEGRGLYAAMREACNVWAAALDLPESQ